MLESDYSDRGLLVASFIDAPTMNGPHTEDSQDTMRHLESLLQLASEMLRVFFGT